MTLLKRYDGDWNKVRRARHVRRLIVSEKDRVGIGTFQPKDEKNQDSTELTGDINYRKIAEYGSDSDPRAFNFDGELNIANRGMCEFIEVLKLDVAFLYDLLGASQEHTIKPKKFAQTDIDEVIIGHTNEPEYKKLQSNELMEAFRDRTIKIDIPYNIRLSDEIKIYEKDFSKERVKGIHIAPHTVEMAAMWAVLTRLEEPKKAGLTLMQKLKLYDGRNASRASPRTRSRSCARRRRAKACRASARATSRTRSPTRWSASRPTSTADQPVHGHERARVRAGHHSSDHG
jgi:serine protein kinase